MSLNRYAKKRDTSEREIITTLETVGMHVHQLDRPVDLVAGYRGLNYLIEVKTGKAKPNAEQAEFIETWRGQVVVLRDAQEAMDWCVEVCAK